VFGTLFVSKYYSRVTLYGEYSYDGTIIGGPHNGIIVRLRTRQKYFIKNNGESFTIVTVELLGSKSTVIRVVA
ncbi:hypothetical protein, partial [Listeria monocytogenes]|uniref:hypothetical protein n=1 Tax=Listeria monocytogenes TaxID=1639 RepID=UPI001F27B00E